MQKYKDGIRNVLRGFENSIRCKGLVKILDDIESNTDLDESTIHSKYNIFYNMAVMSLRRSKRKGQENWINNETSYILSLLYTYRLLCSSVYKTDKSLLDWYRSSASNEDLFWKLNDISNNLLISLKNTNSILFLYEDTLYKIEGYGANNVFPSPHIEIQTIGVGLVDSLPVSFAYNFEDTDNKEETPERIISCVCNCKSCPRYKQSNSEILKDDSRRVNCSWQDCQKCSGFNNKHLLRPLDCEDLYKALFICINTKSKYNESKSGVDKEYEHIPMPMRTDDVIIYYGDTKSKIERFKDKFTISEDTGIVASHASPREHERRGGIRRAYTRKDGVKVRATTFKSTTVNRGNTKTTYKLKERK